MALKGLTTLEWFRLVQVRVAESLARLSGTNVADLRGTEAWLRDFEKAAEQLKERAPKDSQTRERWAAVEEYLKKASPDDPEISRWGAFAASLPNARRPNRPIYGPPLPEPKALTRLSNLWQHGGLDRVLHLYNGGLGNHERYGLLAAVMPRRTWYETLRNSQAHRRQIGDMQRYPVPIVQRRTEAITGHEVGRIICNFQKHPNGAISLELGSMGLPSDLQQWCTDRLLDRWFDVLMINEVILVPPFDRVLSFDEFRNRLRPS